MNHDATDHVISNLADDTGDYLESQTTISVNPESVPDTPLEPDRFSDKTSEELVSMLNTEYKVYSYITTDNEPGAIIIDPKLEVVFNENKLFKMEDVRTKVIKLKDILEKGFVNVGSVDLMETISIRYPHAILSSSALQQGTECQPSLKPLIKGIYLHGSRKRLIAEPTNINFSYDPESDRESVDFSDDDNLNDDDTLHIEPRNNDNDQKENDDTNDQKSSNISNLSWLCE